MASITKIEIDGFKAFPNSFSLDLKEGLNLLIYGENGSGKSSIYYALHVLFQSVLKDDKGAKYFTAGDPHGEDFFVNNENLININRFDEVKHNNYDPYIRVTFEDGQIWRLNIGGLSSENGGDESDIRMLNKNSAFINHSYISRFHAARNSEEIDLWNVFYKDIFPFYIPPKTNEFLDKEYNDIVGEYNNTKPNVKNTIFQDKIKDFNTHLMDLVNDINKRSSDIYNTNFKNEDDKNLLIKVIYYADDANENKHQEHFYLHYGNHGQVTERVDLYPPKIGLEIEEDGQLIYKPQSYFNEAKLTAIALSVRFAAMTSTFITIGSFLALDDMLISLDMSNRMKVIRYLLDEVAPKYKLYVFTHDRLFYHTFKRIIETQYTKSEWLFGGLYSNDSEEPIRPIFKPEITTKIEDIDEAYALHDYFRCGTLLRIQCEQCLKELLPDSLRVKENVQTKSTEVKNLDDQISSLEDFCTHERIDYTPFKDLKIYKDLFLNSTAHNDITSPFYRNEVKICKQAIASLTQINRAKTIQCKQDFYFEFQTLDGKNCLVSMRRREPIRLLEYNGQQRISYYSKCEIRKIIVDGNDIVLTEGFESIYQAYFYVCQNYNCPSNLVLLDILKDRNGYLKDNIK